MTKIDGGTSERVTASQLLLGSIRVAECLQHYGIKAGDSVAVCCENRFEVPHIMFAVFFIGATYVPLNPTYSESTDNFSFKSTSTKYIGKCIAFSVLLGRVVESA